jgi:hypothetical protein
MMPRLGVSQQEEGEKYMKLLLLLGTGILLVLGITGSGAFAAPKETCVGPAPGGGPPTPISGSHGSVTVTGTCAVVGPVTINGDLTLADDAVFVGGFGPAVQVTGNVRVGNGALLLLGYNRPEGVVGPTTVGGNIVAHQPLSLYLGNITVHGNVVSNGGGTADRFYNFPIKDNVIDGNLIIHGWTGGWWGAIANTVGGNVDVSNNRSVVHAAGVCEGTFPLGCAAAPGAFIDSSEVQSRIGNPQRISGNLICHNNTPTAQVNVGDGGAANVVGGNSIGECPPRMVNNNPS